MINRQELDAQTMAMLEIMADDMNVTVDELLQAIEEAKQDFYKTALSQKTAENRRPAGGINSTCTSLTSTAFWHLHRFNKQRKSGHKMRP